MPVSKYLAFDFGAESGRAIIGYLEQDRLRLEEIHRFPNRPVNLNGRYYWDILYLFEELKKGLRIAAASGHTDIASIGVDTWGVDFGLLDRNGHLVGNPVSYRDARTNGMMEKVFSRISAEKIYEITGLQFMQLNTLYQLYSMVDERNPQLDIAGNLLFMPDLFNYMLTGRITAEYTIASTSQLLEVRSRTWSEKLFTELALPLKIMPEVRIPGFGLGSLLPEICRETGMPPVTVTAPAGHDTACAVAAVPASGEDWAYLSSGTWSLLGVELDKPLVSEESRGFGFTNEGGVGGTIRFLKNIMGMWLLERCREIWQSQGLGADYKQLNEKAEAAAPFRSVIDPADQSFMNPSDMIQAVSDFCRNTGQPEPLSEGEIVRCIFESLAMKYRQVIEQINQLRGKPVRILHIVGGGSKNRLLNQYIADSTGIPVIAGPDEGTATGNILLQAMATGTISGLGELRKIIRNSFKTVRFEPQETAPWDRHYQSSKRFFGE